MKLSLRAMRDSDIHPLMELHTEDDYALLRAYDVRGETARIMYFKGLMGVTQLIHGVNHGIVGTITCRNGQLGIWVAEPYRRLGVASRGLALYFKIWASRQPLWAACWADNHASARTLLRVGFEETDMLDRHYGRPVRWFIRDAHA